MNRVVIAGRLTRRPELKQTKSGKSVCDFSIAVNRGIIDQDGQQQVDFINCRTWNKQAENLTKYQDKGSYIVIEGTLIQDHYTDKEGKNREFLYVMAENIEYAPKSKQEPKNTNDEWGSAKDIQLTEEDLPFYG